MKKEMSRAQRRRQAKIRKMILSLSMVLVLSMAAVGGTIAWLTANTQTVTNTFTVGNIAIELDEHKYDQVKNELTSEETLEGNSNYKMVPGLVLPKDPKVTVKGGSENAWIFVKVEKSSTIDTFIDYAIDSNWKALTDVAGVYYREYTAATADAEYPILANNQVTVKSTVTKADMDAQAATSPAPVKPELKFTAYAIQSDNLTAADGTKVETAAAAWALLNP